MMEEYVLCSPREKQKVRKFKKYSVSSSPFVYFRRALDSWRFDGQKKEIRTNDRKRVKANGQKHVRG